MKYLKYKATFFWSLFFGGGGGGGGGEDIDHNVISLSRKE